MASIKTFGKPITLKGIKSLIDKDKFIDELTYFEQGLILTDQPRLEEIRGLNFRPDVVMIYNKGAQNGTGKYLLQYVHLLSDEIRFSYRDDVSHMSLYGFKDSVNNPVSGVLYTTTVMYNDGFSIPNVGLSTDEKFYIQWFAFKVLKE